MKWLLNLFPRTFLIRASIFFRPLLKWYYKGTRFTDPIDGSQYRKFLAYGYQNSRPNALCPGTLSLERHRLLWVYLERFTSLLKDSKKVLHVAPEQAFYKKFKSQKKLGIYHHRSQFATSRYQSRFVQPALQRASI